MIAIFTNKEDAHPTNVINYLVGWGVPVLRLNTECLLTDYEFAWWSNEHGIDFYIKNTKNQISTFGHEITAIWDRRPKWPQELSYPHKNSSLNKFNLSEAKFFLQYLRMYLKDIYSIGSISHDNIAESKILQTEIARQLGMLTPYTCMTNKKDFITSRIPATKYYLLKPFKGDSILASENTQWEFYARKISAHQMFSLPNESFSQTVSFLQHYIEKKYELRITVCCDDIVACKIDSQAQTDTTGKIDWRQGYEHNLKHEIVDIPNYIKDFCHAFLKKMKLNFGCFDFIVTPNDEYVFLECNPNGQWLWIEEETGYDISKIIAKNLAKYEKDVSV